MSDMLYEGADWLTQALKESASQPVTYRRGTASATLAATIGYSDSSNPSLVGGVSIERTTIDFIIPVADLVLDGVAIEPQINDVIDFAGDRYEVHRPDTNEPFAYSDVDGTAYRIHAKYVETL